MGIVRTLPLRVGSKFRFSRPLPAERQGAFTSTPQSTFSLLKGEVTVFWK